MGFKIDLVDGGDTNGVLVVSERTYNWLMF